MKGYKIYLTKSYEVAMLLSQVHKCGEEIESVSFGNADNFDEVPEILKGEKYFACVITYKNQERAFYDIVLA